MSSRSQNKPPALGVRASARASLLSVAGALILLGLTFYNAALTTSDIIETIKPRNGLPDSPAFMIDDPSAPFPDGAEAPVHRSYRMRDEASIPPDNAFAAESRGSDGRAAEDALARAAADAATRVCPPIGEAILAGGLHHQLQDLAAYLATACSTAPVGASVALPAFLADEGGGGGGDGALDAAALGSDGGGMGGGAASAASNGLLPFAAIFDAAPIALAAKAMCRIATGPSTPDEGGGGAEEDGNFGDSACTQFLRQTGNAVVPQRSSSSKPLPPGAPKPLKPYPFAYRSLVYRGLALTPRLRAVVDRCAVKRDALWGGHGKPFLAVHVRIEEGWRARCEALERGFSGLRACFTPADIAAVVQRKFARHPGLHRIMLIGALDRAAPDLLEGPGSVFEVWGPQTRVFAANSREYGCFSPGGPGAGLSYTERAAVETFLAVGADEFIGTAASSFSYGVAMLRAAKAAQAAGVAAAAAEEGSGGTPAATSWSYFCPSPTDFPGARERFMPWEAAHASGYTVPVKKKKKGQPAPPLKVTSFALPYKCME
jgi:hypothetical protein